MKESPIFYYHLGRKTKFVACVLLVSFEIIILMIAVHAFLKKDYVNFSIMIVGFVLIILGMVEFLINSCSVYKEYCIIKTWNHPLGKAIKWSNIDEVYLRHTGFYHSQRIIIRYHEDNRTRQKELTMFCDELDDINSIIPYLDPVTKVRTY